MADSENESRLDEMERDSLQKVISEVERALAASVPGSRMALINFLENAKSRVATLDKKIKDSQVARETRANEQASVAYLAQKEAALSGSEKETFSGFLGKEFFTKKDFGDLDQFYTRTWDHLSEGGKDQMSHRIWEGVRRDKYTFGELPKTVREKETEHAYMRLRDSSIGLGSASRIPETDRGDFIRAYEGGRREEAGKILERESFKANMFRESSSKEVRHSPIGHGNVESATVVAKTRSGESINARKTPVAEAGSLAELDVSSIDLGQMKPAENPSHGSVDNLPRKQGNLVREI